MPQSKLIPLSEVSLLDMTGLRVGRLPTRQTVWNWATKGVRRDPASESAGRLKLSAVENKGRYFTTAEDVRNFLNAYAKITGRGNRL